MSIGNGSIVATLPNELERPMSISTMSSRELNQDVGRAKRSALTGPVIITDRGRPAYVLLTIDEYRRLTGAVPNIVDLLALDQAADVDLPPVPRSEVQRSVDLT